MSFEKEKGKTFTFLLAFPDESQVIQIKNVTTLVQQEFLTLHQLPKLLFSFPLHQYVLTNHIM